MSRGRTPSLFSLKEHIKSQGITKARAIKAHLSFVQNTLASGDCPAFNINQYKVDSKNPFRIVEE